MKLPPPPLMIIIIDALKYNIVLFPGSIERNKKLLCESIKFFFLKLGDFCSLKWFFLDLILPGKFYSLGNHIWLSLSPLTYMLSPLGGNPVTAGWGTHRPKPAPQCTEWCQGYPAVSGWCQQGLETEHQHHWESQGCKRCSGAAQPVGRSCGKPQEYILWWVAGSRGEWGRTWVVARILMMVPSHTHTCFSFTHREPCETWPAFLCNMLFRPILECAVTSLNMNGKGQLCKCKLRLVESALFCVRVMHRHTWQSRCFRLWMSD